MRKIGFAENKGIEKEISVCRREYEAHTAKREKTKQWKRKKRARSERADISKEGREERGRSRESNGSRAERKRRARIGAQAPCADGLVAHTRFFSRYYTARNRKRARKRDGNTSGPFICPNLPAICRVFLLS